MTAAQALREALGLSRRELASALGVSERTIYRWDDGEQEPTGLAAEVLGAVRAAIEDGRDPLAVGRRVKLGVRALVYFAITKRALKGGR